MVARRWGVWAASAVVGLVLATAADAADPPAIPIYPAGTLPVATTPERTDVLMGERRVRNVSQPSLTPVFPAPGKANGTAVIIAPGGGFMMLSWDSEGLAVARRLADAGVTAFVLKYRLDPTPADPAAFTKALDARLAGVAPQGPGGAPADSAAEKAAAADAAQAVKLVRGRAREWKLDPARIGFVGFSAGAMTASNVATGDKAGRPDFVGIIYGALRNPVPADAPPAFIATAADDPLLKDAAIPMFQAWRAAHRPAELHLFETGGHGFGMNVQGKTSDHWFDEFAWWMQARGLLKRAGATR